MSMDKTACGCAAAAVRILEMPRLGAQSVLGSTIATLMLWHSRVAGQLSIMLQPFRPSESPCLQRTKRLKHLKPRHSILSPPSQSTTISVILSHASDLAVVVYNLLYLDPTMLNITRSLKTPFFLLSTMFLLVAANDKIEVVILQRMIYQHCYQYTRAVNSLRRCVAIHGSVFTLAASSRRTTIRCDTNTGSYSERFRIDQEYNAWDHRCAAGANLPSGLPSDRIWSLLSSKPDLLMKSATKGEGASWCSFRHAVYFLHSFNATDNAVLGCMVSARRSATPESGPNFKHDRACGHSPKRPLRCVVDDKSKPRSDQTSSMIEIINLLSRTSAWCCRAYCGYRGS